MSNKYSKRELVSVTPFTNSGLAYGFRSASDASEKADLGQVAVDMANPPAGLVIGASAPKPGRASKKFATKVVSSYFDITKLATLKAADWKIVKMPFIRRAKTMVLAKSVKITTGGIKHAWNMPLETYNAIGATNLTGLGITDADANDKDLVWGADYPKLPRASTVQTGGNIISTFVDPTKLNSLPTGWFGSGKEYVA